MHFRDPAFVPQHVNGRTWGFCLDLGVLPSGYLFQFSHEIFCMSMVVKHVSGVGCRPLLRHGPEVSPPKYFWKENHMHNTASCVLVHCLAWTCERNMVRKWNWLDLVSRTFCTELEVKIFCTDLRALQGSIFWLKGSVVQTPVPPLPAMRLMIHISSICGVDYSPVQSEVALVRYNTDCHSQGPP